MISGAIAATMNPLFYRALEPIAPYGNADARFNPARPGDARMPALESNVIALAEFWQQPSAE